MTQGIASEQPLEERCGSMPRLCVAAARFLDSLAGHGRFSSCYLLYRCLDTQNHLAHVSLGDVLFAEMLMAACLGYFIYLLCANAEKKYQRFTCATCLTCSRSATLETVQEELNQMEMRPSQVEMRPEQSEEAFASAAFRV